MATVFKGTRRLQDLETGEVLDTQLVEKTVGDVGFHKVWLHEILDLVDEIGNSKMVVLMWLLKNADAQNRIFATGKEIAQGSGTSERTVAALLSKLREADVITKVRHSVWRLNPDVIFKGDHNRRMAVLIRYKDETQADLFDAPAVAPMESPSHLKRVA